MITTQINHETKMLVDRETDRATWHNISPMITPTVMDMVRWKVGMRILWYVESQMHIEFFDGG
jgi:hypothetical protein